MHPRAVYSSRFQEAGGNPALLIEFVEAKMSVLLEMPSMVLVALYSRPACAWAAAGRSLLRSIEALDCSISSDAGEKSQRQGNLKSPGGSGQSYFSSWWRQGKRWGERLEMLVWMVVDGY